MLDRRMRLVMAAMFAVVPLASAGAAETRIERGRYLVAIAGCGDCHTPGGLIGHPDQARYLGGSDVGFAIPGQGVFVGPNLTPDHGTGLGSGASSRS